MKANLISNHLAWNPRTTAIACAILAWSLLGAKGSGSLSAQTPCPEVQVLSDALLGPSKIIQTPAGHLLVAETGPEESNSGRVSLVDVEGHRRTLLEGLPSGRTSAGDFNGTSGLLLHGRRLYVVNGQGDVTLPGPTQNTERGNPNPASPIFASVLVAEFPSAIEALQEGFALTLDDHQSLHEGDPVTVSNASQESATIRLVVDFTDYVPEPRPDFAENVRHSNPYGIVADETYLYIIDAGLNNVRKVEIASGTEHTLTSFPPTPNPSPKGPPMIENVPSSIHWAGGRLLVTTFGGTPFLPGGSKVWRIDPQTGAADSLIEGLTTAIDAIPLAPANLLAGVLTLEYNLSFPYAGQGQLRFYPTPTSTPVTQSLCLNAPSSMLYDTKHNRLILAELSAGRLITVPIPRSLAQGDAWTRKTDMPTPRAGLSASTLNGEVYAIGGATTISIDSLSTVEAYDPERDAWAEKTPMPTPRTYSAAAVFNGRIYVFGGDRTFLTNPLPVVEEYDPISETWTRKADMPTARSVLAAAVVETKIYVIGGLTTWGSPPLAIVEAYDPATDTWERKADMPTARGGLCASVVDGRIFAIGSTSPGNPPNTSTHLAVVEMYDPVADVWTRKADMPTARGALASSSADGRIYVVGGSSGGTPLATVEEYDPLTDTWARRTGMSWPTSGTPAGRFALASATVNGRIYAMGGAAGFPPQGLSLVLEYTLPNVPPALRMEQRNDDGLVILQLEWLSRTDALDRLQFQTDLHSENWIDLDWFSGNGEILTMESPATAPTQFYRLVRELR
jgi:N-acetylneuraminic acid mutarotase